MPTRLLAPIVEEMLAEALADIGGDGDDKGAVRVLAERAAHIKTDVSAQSFARRLWDIRTGVSKATRASVGEALLMAGGREHGIVPELPAGLDAARERIEIWLDLAGGEMSKRDIKELAEDLLEFSRLMILGVEEEQVEEAELFELPPLGQLTLIVGDAA
jgi:hypothetical protein